MARESTLWNTLKRNLKKCSKVTWDRIENSAGTGMADVNLAYQHRDTGLPLDVWIELKHVRKRPVRPGTPVRVKFQDTQPQWLLDRWVIGRNAYILLQVDNEYFLFKGNKAYEIEMGLSVFGLHAIADWNGKRLSDLLEWLGVRPA